MGELTREQHLRIHYCLRLTRALEERVAALGAQGKVLGSVFRSLGQEATSVGAAAALERSKGDIVAPALRDLGAMLTLGATPLEILRQFLAKADAPSHGRDQGLHFGSPSRGFVGPVSVLGDMIPVSAGLALGAKMHGTDAVVLCFIGDGGFSTGPTHEGLNFAAVQDLPLVLVIVNNGFAFSTPTDRQARIRRLAIRAKAYGIPGVTVDGNDVLEVHTVVSEAIEHARRGAGPSIVEAVTFRLEGHAQHDDQSYVNDAVLEEWRAKDPIARYERVLVARGLVCEAELASIAASVESELDLAVATAEASPAPDPISATRGVYAGSTASHAPWLLPIS